MLDFEIQAQAEQEILGAMMFDPKCISKVLSEVRQEEFHSEINRAVYKAIKRLYQDGKEVDGLTVKDELSRTEGSKENWEQVVTNIYLMAVTAANWLAYADILHNQHMLSNLYEIAVKLPEAIKGAADAEECRTAVSKLTEALSRENGKQSFDLEELFDSFYAKYAEGKQPPHIKFGFEELDASTRPQPGNVVMIAAEPDVGKTAFGILSAFRMSEKFRVGYFTIDTEADELINRLISSQMGVSYTRLNSGNLLDSEWDAIADALPAFVEHKLTIVDAAGFDLATIKEISRAHEFEVIFIDYVQQIKPENPRAVRFEQMSQVAMGLKLFARQSKTLVVELAQIQRPDANVWREPNMHSIKESGQFEQDADLMLMLYRPNPEEDAEQETHRILKIAKNKKGVQNRFPLYFDGDKQMFWIADIAHS